MLPGYNIKVKLKQLGIYREIILTNTMGAGAFLHFMDKVVYVLYNLYTTLLSKIRACNYFISKLSFLIENYANFNAFVFIFD